MENTGDLGDPNRSESGGWENPGLSLSQPEAKAPRPCPKNTSSPTDPQA